MTGLMCLEMKLSIRILLIVIHMDILRGDSEIEVFRNIWKH